MAAQVALSIAGSKVTEAASTPSSAQVAEGVRQLWRRVPDEEMDESQIALKLKVRHRATSFTLAAGGGRTHRTARRVFQTRPTVTPHLRAPADFAQGCGPGALGRPSRGPPGVGEEAARGVFLPGPPLAIRNPRPGAAPLTMPPPTHRARPQPPGVIEHRAACARTGVQGDEEKKKALPVSPLMDREKPGITTAQAG